MNNLQNLPPFFVGQKVVCIKSHSWDFVKKGNIYTIADCFYNCCGWVVLVNGVYNKILYVRCYCGKIKRQKDERMLLDPSLFSPIQQTKFPLMSFSEIKEKEKVEVLGNN